MSGSRRAQLVHALKRNGMWSNTILVFSSDNGGDSGDSSNPPLRGRKRTFFEGGVRAAAFVASPLLGLPTGHSRRRAEVAEVTHISDWYATIGALAGIRDPTDEGEGRFAVDGRALWPFLSGAAAAPPPFANGGVLVLGFNYSTLCFGQPRCRGIPGCPSCGRYDMGSGALLEPSSGYKLIVGSQAASADTMDWGPADYPCAADNSSAAERPDCEPQCLYNVLRDEDERHELSHVGGKRKPMTREDGAALGRLLKLYAAIGTQRGMPNPLDVQWNEQGTPYDAAACKAASLRGYWRPWKADDGAA